jgi:hypothetical protein
MQLATAATLLALCACQTDQEGARLARVRQDLSFMRGCWKGERFGDPSMLRVRPARGNAGLVAEQTEAHEVRTRTRVRWSFAADGSSVTRVALEGDEDGRGTAKTWPAAARSEIHNPGARKGTAFFWSKPDELFLEIIREGDRLQLIARAMPQDGEVIVITGNTYFEGRLSGCD